MKQLVHDLRGAAAHGRRPAIPGAVERATPSGAPRKPGASARSAAANPRRGRLAWAARATLLLLVSTGCGDVRKCEVGSPGCKDGEPLDGKCFADLEIRDGKCAEPQGADRPGDAGTASCDCEAPTVCAPDGQSCIQYCAPSDQLPGTVEPPEPIFCEGEQPLSFEELCQRRCQLRCRLKDQYCPEPEACACDGAAALESCQEDCGDESDPQLCLQRSCNDVRAQGCSANIPCPDGQSPDCEDVRCENDCVVGGTNYAFDGYCDDGDFDSAFSGLCEYGTDCADCGPRRGRASEPKQLGEVCAFNSDCIGASLRLTESDAWCVEADKTIGVPRCMPDCSRDQGCPAGSRCVELATDQDGDGEFDDPVQDPITGEDYDGAAACFPVSCEE